MEILKRKMGKLVGEEADERLTSLLLASYDKEAPLDQLIGYLELVSSSLTQLAKMGCHLHQSPL